MVAKVQGQAYRRLTGPRLVLAGSRLAIKQSACDQKALYRVKEFLWAFLLRQVAAGLDDDNLGIRKFVRQPDAVGCGHYPIVVSGDDQDRQLNCMQSIGQVPVRAGEDEGPQGKVPMVGEEWPPVAVPDLRRDLAGVVPGA